MTADAFIPGMALDLKGDNDHGHDNGDDEKITFHKRRRRVHYQTQETGSHSQGLLEAASAMACDSAPSGRGLDSRTRRAAMRTDQMETDEHVFKDVDTDADGLQLGTGVQAQAPLTHHDTAISHTSTHAASASRSSTSFATFASTSHERKPAQQTLIMPEFPADFGSATGARAAETQSQSAANRQDSRTPTIAEISRPKSRSTSPTASINVTPRSLSPAPFTAFVSIGDSSSSSTRRTRSESTSSARRKRRYEDMGSDSGNQRLKKIGRIGSIDRVSLSERRDDSLRADPVASVRDSPDMRMRSTSPIEADATAASIKPYMSESGPRSGSQRRSDAAGPNRPDEEEGGGDGNVIPPGYVSSSSSPKRRRKTLTTAVARYSRYSGESEDRDVLNRDVGSGMISLDAPRQSDSSVLVPPSSRFSGPSESLPLDNAVPKPSASSSPPYSSPPYSLVPIPSPPIVAMVGSAPQPRLPSSRSRSISMSSSTSASSKSSLHSSSSSAQIGAERGADDNYQRQRRDLNAHSSYSFGTLSPVNAVVDEHYHHTGRVGSRSGLGTGMGIPLPISNTPNTKSNLSKSPGHNYRAHHAHDDVPYYHHASPTHPVSYASVSVLQPARDASSLSTLPGSGQGAEQHHVVRSPPSKLTSRMSRLRASSGAGTVSVGIGSGGHGGQTYDYGSDDSVDELDPGYDDRLDGGSDYDNDSSDAHDVLMRSAGGQDSPSVGRQASSSGGPGGADDYGRSTRSGASGSGSRSHRGLSGRASPSPYPAASHHPSPSASGVHNTRRSTQAQTQSSLAQQTPSYSAPSGSGSGAGSGSQSRPSTGGTGTGTKRRGNLPKEVTEVLKGWILSHADNPYPSDEEKRTLCSQTGLSYVQVSNWMINARRRVLPPENKHKYQRPSAAASGLPSTGPTSVGGPSSVTTPYPPGMSSSSSQVTLPPLSALLSQDASVGDDVGASSGGTSGSGTGTRASTLRSSRMPSSGPSRVAASADYSRPGTPTYYGSRAPTPTITSVGRSGAPVDPRRVASPPPASSHDRRAGSNSSYAYDDRQPRRELYMLPDPIASSSNYTAAATPGSAYSPQDTRSRSRVLSVQELTAYPYTEAQAEYARNLAIERGYGEGRNSPTPRASSGRSSSTRWDDPERRTDPGGASGSGSAR